MKFVILILGILIAVVCAQKQFNAFKSYRHAKVKPPHYAKKEVRNHPIYEYLSENQERMMNHRQNKKDHKDATFKHNWTGFDKDRRKLENIPNDTSNIEVDSTSSFDYLRWLCLISVISSVCWIIYLFTSRRYYEGKISAAVKDNLIVLSNV